jgi:Uma2 family endonuclease
VVNPISQPLTVDEYLQLVLGPDTELIRGVVVDVLPPKRPHGRIAARLVARLEQWLTDHDPGGECGVEAGFILERDPDTLRGPDVYYVSAERLAAAGDPNGYWEIAPDLAVEVISPSDRQSDWELKTAMYLAVGSRLVWLVFPDQHQVIAHLPNRVGRAFRAGRFWRTLRYYPAFKRELTSCLLGWGRADW